MYQAHATMTGAGTGVGIRTQGTSHQPAARSTVAVVIPAHDEERPLARTLRSLAAQGGREVPEVVVVANGCSDGTADVARAAGVRVVELAEPSKAAALTAGDAAVVSYPRIYLDADVVLAPGTLDALAAALRRRDVLVAAPQIAFDASASSWPVRAFYAVYRELPYVTDGLVGLGVYGLSERGRSRFGDFPRLTSDDLFVQRLFDSHERVTTEGQYVVAAPRDLRNLLKVRTRTAAGNAELGTAGTQDGDVERFGRTTGSTVTALAQLLVRQPRLLPSVAVYVGVTIASRVQARRGSPGAWHRDTSTR